METVEHTINTFDSEVKIKVSKIAEVKLGKGNGFIYYDKLNDGTWRMVYTKGVIGE